jgi:hypothetical protein
MPKFSGGVSIDDRSYLVIKAGPCRDIRVHQLVAEAKLGRKLLPDEHIHHRNLCTLDPSPDNLLVLGKSEHGYVSNRQAWFLKNRERRELKWWQEWIETGANRPAVGDDGELVIGEDPTDGDIDFNPEDLARHIGEY